MARSCARSSATKLTRQITRELYASRRDVRKAAPWAEQLASAQPTTEAPESFATRQPLREEDGDAVDSDDETDVFPPKPEPQSSRSPTAVIRVDDAAYTTVRAVLLWLATGHIAFAPLTSKVGKAERVAYIRRYADEHPDLPLPASPRAVYRLAQLLCFEDLSVRSCFVDDADRSGPRLDGLPRAAR